MTLTSTEMVRLAVEAMDERKGRRVVTLDLTGLTVVTDFFVICTGTSTTHMQGIADRVEEKLIDGGAKLLHREGGDKSGWILLDYGDIVVHIFDELSRDFYNLERLWGDAKPVETAIAQAGNQ